VTHYWGDKPNSATVMQHAQPDPIWSQCDIQFRMVSYSACAVDRAVFDNDSMCGGAGACGTEFSHSHASTVINAFNACASAQNKPGKPVIVTGSLDNIQCPGQCLTPTIGITDSPEWSIVTQEALALSGGGTIAHELGHLLGVDGHSTNQNDLMYDKHIAGSPHLIGSDQCAKARTQAAIYQSQVIW